MHELQWSRKTLPAAWTSVVPHTPLYGIPTKPIRSWQPPGVYTKKRSTGWHPLNHVGSSFGDLRLRHYKQPHQSYAEVLRTRASVQLHSWLGRTRSWMPHLGEVWDDFCSCWYFFAAFFQGDGFGFHRFGRFSVQTILRCCISSNDKTDEASVRKIPSKKATWKLRAQLVHSAATQLQVQLPSQAANVHLETFSWPAMAENAPCAQKKRHFLPAVA